MYNVVLVSAVQHSESAIHIHTTTVFFRFFSHIGHYGVLSRVPCAVSLFFVPTPKSTVAT